MIVAIIHFAAATVYIVAAVYISKLLRDLKDTRRELRRLYARMEERQQIRLVGGPLDGEETTIARGVRELRVPLGLRAYWTDGNGNYSEPPPPRSRVGIYKRPQTLEYAGEEP